MRKVPLPESDSDHMHRCAMCAMLLSQPPDPHDDYSGDAGRFHPDKASLRGTCKLSHVPTMTFCSLLFTSEMGPQAVPKVSVAVNDSYRRVSDVYCMAVIESAECNAV